MHHGVLFSLLSSLALSTGALAQHAGDVLVGVQNNRLVTGLLDEDQDAPASGPFKHVRVFGSEFGELFPDFTDEPGFDSGPAAFTPGTQFSFNIRDAIRRWNGADFSTIPSQTITAWQAFGVPFSPSATTPTVAGVSQSGFVFGTADGAGELHEHPEWTLDAPHENGVYLVELELFTPNAGFETSRPFFFVFNAGADEADHDAAIEYAEHVLVPAPGAVSAVALAGVALVRRRRR